jgi:hypothetical protein
LPPTQAHFRLSADVERASSFEDDVELIVVVDPLVIGFGRDERVDEDLEPGRRVDELIATVSGAKASLGFRDVERARPIRCFGVGVVGFIRPTRVLP